MDIQPTDGNNQYCAGDEIRMKCHQGFYFVDISTEKISTCVDLGHNKSDWSFLDSCYPRNYLNFNIIKISTELYQIVN